MNGAAESSTRTMHWSVRRELWENRSIFFVPLIVEGFVMFGFLISLITLPRRMNVALALGAAEQREAVTMPYDVAAGLVMLTAFVVGFFYCLEALHGERRDRSILFWKSLPVSDRTTVLSKASIPLVVLPLFIFVIIIGAQLMMLLLSTVVLLGNGAGVAALWTHVKFFQLWVAELYALIAIALWHAPIYGWLLLVSGWAKRATFLWAVLPLIVIAIFEKITFDTHYFSKL